MQQLVLTNSPLDLSNFAIYCLPKEGQHALYMLNPVLFGSLYSSEGKGLRTKSLKEEQTIYFQLVEDILFFSNLMGNKLFFSKKSQPPPEYQMVRPLIGIILLLSNIFLPIY